MGTNAEKVRALTIVPMDDRERPSVETRSRRAARAILNAGIERRLAQSAGRGAAGQLEDAKRLESVAIELMRPVGAPVVSCGEVTRVPGEPRQIPSEITNTLSNPNQAAIDASASRTNLLLDTPGDIVPLAVDAAASANADNSLEKMLAHQLAMMHTLVMKTGARALEFEKRQGTTGEGFMQADSVELARLVQATSRLASSFQDGLLTMQRLRSGSSQTVTVRHVTVQSGGQAVIGNVGTGGPPSRKSTGRGRSK